MPKKQAWQAICAGSNGIFFFAFWDTLRDPDVPFATEWLRLSAIAAEIDRFAPVLLSDAGPPTMVTLGGTPGGEQVTWLATRSHCGDTAAGESDHLIYIFAVNNGNGAGLVSFNLGGRHNVTGAVRVVSESPVRGIEAQPDGGVFVDTIQRLVMLVYQITSDSPCAASIFKTVKNPSSKTDDHTTACLKERALPVKSDDDDGSAIVALIAAAEAARAAAARATAAAEAAAAVPAAATW